MLTVTSVIVVLYKVAKAIAVVLEVLQAVTAVANNIDQIIKLSKKLYDMIVRFLTMVIKYFKEHLC